MLLSPSQTHSGTLPQIDKPLITAIQKQTGKLGDKESDSAYNTNYITSSPLFA